MIRGRWRAQSVIVAVCAVVLSSCGGDLPVAPTPTPPPPLLTLTCPASPSGTSHNNQPATITWTAPTAAGGTAPYTVTCTPASGTQFAPGATTVSCQAADAAARTATCSFQVSVSRIPQIASTRFLSFGDSMTEGKVSPAPFVLIDAPESYPYKLGQLLANRFLDQQVVVFNDGLGGERTEDGAKRLPGSIAQTSPQAVMLWEGANDLLAFEGSAIPNIIEGLGDQIRIAKANNAKVFLATHPPQRPGTQRGYAAKWVPPLNAQIAALAASQNVTLVDLYAGFPSDISTTVGVDGLHLTDQGYTLVAQIFFDAISKTMDVPYPSPTPLSAR